MAKKLKTETDTPEMRLRVEEAALVLLNMGSDDGDLIDVFFEHGQWWVRDIESDRTYSVCDAVGGDSADGFCLEEIG